MDDQGGVEDTPFTEEQFDGLVRQWQEPLFHFLLTITYGNDHLALDLRQDVLLQAWRKRGQLRDRERFYPWIRTIARRLFINYCKRPSLSFTAGDVADAVDPYEPQPINAVIIREQAAAVHCVLAAMQGPTGDTMRQFYDQGKSVRQIAQSDMPVPSGTVKRRLHVGRRRMQEALDAYR